MSDDDVIDWLLDEEASDPAIRWQVLQDLADAPEEQWRAEQARVATEGWGARLLDLADDDDGQWAGGAHFPSDFAWGGDEEGQPWTSTSHSLASLRQFGLPPDTPRMQELVTLIGEHCTWEYDDLPYWTGEVEPCINGALVSNGAYVGVDMTPVVERLVGERMDDGGWNCEQENGSVRSSFDTTINVVEGLLAHERAIGGDRDVRVARHSGEEYLLERSLFRRRSTGEVADPKFTTLLHPDRWHHHVLRGLEHFRAAALHDGTPPDPRLGEAVELVRSKRDDDGRWPLEHAPRGRVWFHMEDEGDPSRWNTLRASRVLRWWEDTVHTGRTTD